MLCSSDVMFCKTTACICSNKKLVINRTAEVSKHSLTITL